MVHWAKTSGDGRSIWDEVVWRSRIGQLRTEYEVAEVLLWRAIQLHEQGVDYRAQAAMVKLFNTEFAQRLYEAAVELMGLYGLLRRGLSARAIRRRDLA